jgi:hypothetical protein
MKRVRSSDTAAGAAQAFIDAAKGLAVPPRHIQLRPQDLPYWQAIVALRARDQWTEVHLVAAAQLARTQADITTWSELLAQEQPVVYTGPNSIPKVNPLVTAVETATRRQLAIMRALGLVSQEDPEAARKKQQTLTAARKASSAAAEQSLLA